MKKTRNPGGIEREMQLAARHRADQQARRIRWDRLLQTQRDYVSWTEFYFWARSIMEAGRIAIEFTIAHGHEYELLAKDWGARLSRKGPTPSFDLIKARLADQLGGSPDDHLQLALGLVTLYHGASMLLLGEGIDPQTATAIKEACLAAIDSLVASAAKNKFPNRAVG